MTQQAQVQAAPQTKEFDVNEEILKRAGIKKFTDVPLPVFFVWGKRSETNPNPLWVTDEPVPYVLSKWRVESEKWVEEKVSFSNLHVVFMFQNGDEARVYAIDKKNPEIPPHRFTLPRATNTPFIEIIPDVLTFVRAVADELQMMVLTDADFEEGGDTEFEEDDEEEDSE